MHCIQRAGRVFLMGCFDMHKEKQKMLNIFFHTDVTLVNRSTLQGGEWPSMPWYPDTLETGAALQDLSWFIKIHWTSHIQVDCTLTHHIKLQSTSDILPLWGAYVKYPLPTEHSTCAMATGISEKMGGLGQYHEPQAMNAHSVISRTTAGIRL